MPLWLRQEIQTLPWAIGLNPSLVTTAGPAHSLRFHASRRPNIHWMFVYGLAPGRALAGLKVHRTFSFIRLAPAVPARSITTVTVN